MPGPGGVAHRAPADSAIAAVRRAQVARPTVLQALVAAALLAVWVAVNPRTPDLAAQVYRVGLFREAGFAVWDTRWYGGHALPGYSLLFPPLAGWLGMRVVGAASVMASSLLFERLARRQWGRAGRYGAAAFAVAATGDVWIGRLTFAMGVSLALAAALAAARGRWRWAGALSALCAAASPVAAALLGLAGLTAAIAARRPRPLLWLAAPGAVVVGALALLFPEGGYEPYPFLSFAATVGVVAAFVAALPARERLLRVGAGVYGVACVACLLVRTPMGSNVERYGVLLAGPLLVCALLRDRAADDGPARAHGAKAPASWRALARPLPALALAAIATWVLWGPVRETAAAGGAVTSASYYAPVERFLAGVQARTGEPLRVEVPLTRSHWEAARLADTVSLARGWEKQLETKYDAVLLEPGLTAARYERWLHEQAVSYVALADAPLDPSSAREGRLIERGLPYLRLVFTSAHWRVYRVLGATGLTSGPGALTALGHDWFTLRATGAGRVTVRVRYTRYWTMAHGSGCVNEAPGGWTAVSVPRAQPRVLVRASFSLGRAFGATPRCPV